MPLGLNPWLLLGVLLAALALFTGGVSAGKSLERSEWLDREVVHQEAVAKETERANQVAMIYGTALGKSQDTAFNLRRKLDENRKQLAACDSTGAVRLSPAFVGMFNDALQSRAPDPGQPAGEADGASADTVLDVSIENGRRCKACRDQLNALIDILEPQQ